MIVTSNSNPYAGLIDRLTNHRMEMLVPNEDQQKDRRSSSQPGAMTGSDTVFGARLADSLWSMESQGTDIDQAAGDTWLGNEPSTRYEDEFMGLAKKTLAERIREQYLEEHGLTEDDLKAMKPEERKAAEAEIREAILEAMGVNETEQDVAADMGGLAGDDANAGAGTNSRENDPDRS